MSGTTVPGRRRFLLVCVLVACSDEIAFSSLALWS
jgi:hypothetical protein